jgi:AcrR family transcriptional regulator
LTAGDIHVTIGDTIMALEISEGRRPYRMQARAEAVEATSRRILEEAFRLFTDYPYEDVSLEEVGSRSGVTKRTVLRRFESKEQLFVAAMELAGSQIRRQRYDAPVGDVAAIVRNLVEGYERWGPNRLRMIAQEHRIPVVREDVERGRRGHRDSIRRAFAPMLNGLSGPQLRRRVTGLVAITDVYTWKLLRLDLGLSRAETERTLTELIGALKGD